MAKATRHEAVTRTEVVEVEPAKVVLELTLDEARELYVSLGGLSTSHKVFSALFDMGIRRAHAQS